MEDLEFTLLLTQFSFPLIECSFVKLTQLVQFDKNQSCLAIHGTGDCVRLMWHRKLSGLSGRALYDLGSTPKFWSVVKIS